MFATTTNLPNRMLSFDSALKQYNSIKPIRGRQDQNTRPLATRTNDNLTIRQDEANGDIVVRLYQTDIIRYLSDGDGYNNQIELEPYCSVLTNRIVWSILGPHVNTHWSIKQASVPGNITQVNGLYYHTPELATVAPLQEGWQLVAGSKPFTVPYVDRKKSRQTLKDYRYNEFKLWLTTQIRLGVFEGQTKYWHNPTFHQYDVAKNLAEGPTGWAVLGKTIRPTRIDSDLDALRTALYKYEDCYREEVAPHFTSYRALQNALKQMARLF
jgi:hypothetical protein